MAFVIIKLYTLTITQFLNANYLINHRLNLINHKLSSGGRWPPSKTDLLTIYFLQFRSFAETSDLTDQTFLHFL
uniref:Putative secreted protein n=1 Tax=Panstrongylus lignarius TaxID=156445 RepID=A0A224Y495_9HEMI